MNTINVFSRFILILVSITILSGCGVYKTYTGYYLINSCKPIYSKNELEKKSELILVSIASDFGLKNDKKDYPGQDYDRFVKNKNIKGKYDFLDGSGSDVVLIFMGDPLSITIRDYTKKTETPFTAKLKMEIENKLKEICTIEPLFKRDSEFWY